MEMIRKLRIRFVVIMMSIVTIMLVIIFGLVLHLTKTRLENDSLRMMEDVVSSPMALKPNDKHDGPQDMNIRLPFFTVLLDADGNVLETRGDYYDLTDESDVTELVDEALDHGGDTGTLSAYNLRYMISPVDETHHFMRDKRDANASGPDTSAPAEEAGFGSSGDASVNNTALVSKSEAVSQTGEASDQPGEAASQSGEASDQPGEAVSQSGEASDQPDEVASQSGEVSGQADDDAADGSLGKGMDGADLSTGKTILVFTDISSELSTMHNLLRNCILIAIASFLIFLVIAICFAHWAVHPVEEAWKQQRQFVSDASHELKTPLTVILTNVEFLKSREFDETKKLQFVDNIYTMSQQMRGLVESLLQLARVDNGILEKLPSERIDLSKLCENESLTFEVMFFEKGLMLETKLAEDVHVKGAESYMKQVVEILLDNAQKYSDPNGTVTLGLTKNAHHCTLYVANPGDEISPENRKNIFKRFYRGDEARAMNHSYGLGLAIADDIVKGMKGRIWVDSENHLNTFKVELPLA